MLVQGYKIYIALRLVSVCLLVSRSLLLLLLLSVRSHLLAEGEVRHLQAGKGSDTDKQDQKQGDDSSKAHEQARGEVLISLKQTALVARGVGTLVVCGGVALQLHLDAFERVLHLVGVLLLCLELGLGLCFGGRGGDVDDSVILRFGVLGETVFKELVCRRQLVALLGSRCQAYPVVPCTAT